MPQPPTGHPRRDVLGGCGDLGPQRIKPTWDPFPRPRQRKDPRGSPKNPPCNRWGRMLLGSAREDSPRQGCPSSRGCRERPPAVAARAPRYSPLREGSGAERWEGPVPRQVPAPRRSCFICAAPRSDWPGRLPSRDRPPPQLPKNSPDPPRPPQPRAPLPRGCGSPAPSASPEGRPRGGRGAG